ncbi:hypothetical protein QE152_g41468 [Popillia japonica]|uniref:Uncharacterized protein n=2 Tax=Popillia japonica TaxID=7064 RepID=A0AAW1GAG7_POPJA
MRIGRKRVMGSLNPKHINSNLRHTSFKRGMVVRQKKRGMVVWGTILEKSHHIYIVELGCKNTRVILPFKNCQDRTFVEGEPSWFIIRDAAEKSDGILKSEAHKF